MKSVEHVFVDKNPDKSVLFFFKEKIMMSKLWMSLKNKILKFY